ncbi:MAG: hypothetical protein KAH38_05435 [Candidatus Hydrogenedentes bacterium]|nr:hypothetical protein [Candidatus Hydrogenedentota bacterium]
MYSHPLYFELYWTVKFLCIILILTITENSTADIPSDSIYIRTEIKQDSADIYTASLYQNATDVPAATLVLFLIVNPKQITILPRATVEESTNQYIQLAPVQQSAGFIVEDMRHNTIDNMDERSCMSIAIYKTSATGALQPGALLSFTFQLLPDSDEPLLLWVQKNTKETVLSLKGTAFVSSAAAIDAMPLSVIFEAQPIVFGCESFSPPNRVRASWWYRKKIIITWEPPHTDNPLEYQVYRSETDDRTHAIPVHDTWITELTWTDSFSKDTIDTPPSGCSCQSSRYYYWVRTRDPVTGCTSDLSTPPKRGSRINL